MKDDSLEMKDSFSFRYWVLNRIVKLQNQYGGQFYTAAPDKLLLSTDCQYGRMAVYRVTPVFQL
jgi:hypothetical protein